MDEVMEEIVKEVGGEVGDWAGVTKILVLVGWGKI